MRSRADARPDARPDARAEARVDSTGGGRRALELAARGTALVALGSLLWRHHAPAEATVPPASVAGVAALRPALERATLQPVSGLALRLDSIPAPAERAWLAALAAAGTDVRWHADEGVHPLAMTAEALPDPSGRVRVTTLARGGSTIAVRDAAGMVDSSAAGEDGVRVVEGGLEGDIVAHAPGIAAGGRGADSLVLRPVLVLARAGWEGKFTVAALEESGWKVEARFAVAPDVAVRQGGTGGAIDTSRYSAVVALDATAAPSAPAIARFVRDGGGAVIAAAAVRIPALAAIAPARAVDSIPASLGALVTDAPRRGLAAAALRPVAQGAVVLERRGTAPVAVAARVALGRVLLLGYHESWRWRMAGGDGSDAAHRAWWSAIVASVARAPRAPRAPRAIAAGVSGGGPPLAPASPSPPDGAPWAALVAALGAEEGTPLAASPVPPSRLDTLLFALALAGLLAEWVSRRTRGAR